MKRLSAWWMWTAIGIMACALSAEAQETTPLLTAGCRWRKDFTFFPPRLSASACAGVGIKPDDTAKRVAYLSGLYSTLKSGKRARYLSGMATPPAPGGWTALDFDDSDWLLTAGEDFTGALLVSRRGIAAKPVAEDLPAIRGTDPFVKEIGLISLRGKFLAKDRNQVAKLRLSLTYRGGFVAYLNGKEIARADLPAGRIEATTPAADYPTAAFVDAEGKLILNEWSSNTTFDPANKTAPWALRERVFGPVEIDAGLIRDGLNVLAIELHRSDFPSECQKYGLCFAPVGLAELRLEAETPRGNVVSSVETPPDIRVWTAPIWAELGTDDFGDPAELLRPVRIVAARNGAFSGQIVVSSTKPVRGLTAKAGPLRQRAGGAEIPAEAVRLRFGAVNPARTESEFSWFSGVQAQRADMLLDEPPAVVEPVEPIPVEGWTPIVRRSLGLSAKPRALAVAPIWVTVRIPGDAAPGDYQGVVTVAAEGLPPTEAPIEVNVADWTLPDVKDLSTVMFLYQSPWTLARQYKVEPWSPEHLQLIERSCALMQELGNNLLLVAPFTPTQLSNPESMILWVKQADGSYKPDLRIVDAYLTAALKHYSAAQLKAVVVLAYTPSLDDPRAKFQYNVTVLDPATGRKTNMALPAYNSPECGKLLKPAFLALKDLLKAKGLDGLLVWGVAADEPPSLDCVAMLHSILPEVPWYRVSHIDMAALPCDAADRKKVAPVAWTSRVSRGEYTAALKDKGPFGRRPGGYATLLYNRGGTSWFMGGFPEPWRFRCWLEDAVVRGYAGLGNSGGDFFPKGKAGPRGIVTDASQEPTDWNGGWGGLPFVTPDLLAPGPKGAVATVRSENLREGIQDAEAGIFIQKALLNAPKPLPDALGLQCRDLLSERLQAMRAWDTNIIGSLWASALRASTEFGAVGARRRTQRLYELAGEAAKAVR